jgi:hypothetical protein
MVAAARRNVVFLFAAAAIIHPSNLTLFASLSYLMWPISVPINRPRNSVNAHIKIISIVTISVGIESLASYNP